VASQAAKLFVNDRSQAVERALVSIAPGAEEPAYVVCIQLAGHYRPLHPYRLIIAPASARKISAVSVSKFSGILRLLEVEGTNENDPDFDCCGHLARGACRWTAATAL